MKLIDTKKRLNVKRVNKDVVTFEVDGQPEVIVTVSRCLRGWEPHIKISVGNSIWHDDNASDSDKIFFDKLMELAHDHEDANRKFNRDETAKLIRSVIDWRD